MEAKIAEVRGFAIVYDSQVKQFYLKNTDGDVVGQGKTQDEVEVQADKLAKQGYKFPIQAFLVNGKSMEPGRVTSINLDEPSIRFSYGDGQRDFRSRVMCNLKYGAKVYEATEQNQLIKAKIDDLHQDVAKLERQISDFLEQLEKHIDLKYFGL